MFLTYTYQQVSQIQLQTRNQPPKTNQIIKDDVVHIYLYVYENSYK